MWWIGNRILLLECTGKYQISYIYIYGMIILQYLLHALRFVFPLVVPPGGQTLHTGGAVSLASAVW